MKYTYHKFKSFLPYTTVAITLQYIVEAPFSSLKQGNIKEFLCHFLHFPFEVMLIGEALQSDQLLAPIWFLSAMLLAFPVIAFLCQLKNKYLILFISTFYSMFYFGRVQLCNRIWPDDILRALAGMSLGISVYIISEIIGENVKSAEKPNIIVSIIEIVCMLFPLFVTLINIYSLSKWIVLSFALGIGIMLSGYSFSSRLNSNFFSFLGKLSMPMFIWHWLIATVINVICHFFFISSPLKLFLYFGGTIAVSITSYYTVEKARKKSLNAR